MVRIILLAQLPIERSNNFKQLLIKTRVTVSLNQNLKNEIKDY